MSQWELELVLQHSFRHGRLLGNGNPWIFNWSTSIRPSLMAFDAAIFGNYTLRTACRQYGPSTSKHLPVIWVLKTPTMGVGAYSHLPAIGNLYMNLSGQWKSTISLSSRKDVHPLFSTPKACGYGFPHYLPGDGGFRFNWDVQDFHLRLFTGFTMTFGTFTCVALVPWPSRWPLGTGVSPGVSPFTSPKDIHFTVLGWKQGDDVAYRGLFFRVLRWSRWGWEAKPSSCLSSSRHGLGPKCQVQY